MRSQPNETPIGRQLMAGSILAGAAAAGIPEARHLIALLAEAEQERARAAKRAEIEEGFVLLTMKGQNDDATTERRLRAMADDFGRAVSTAITALREAHEHTRLRGYPRAGGRYPGAPAHCRHRRRA